MEKVGHLHINDLLALSLRSFRNRSLRTFLTIAGMGVGIGAVLFLVSLGYGLQYILVGKLAATSDSLLSMEAFFPPESTLTISGTMLEDIEKDARVAEISRVAEIPGEIHLGELVGNISVRSIEDNYFRLLGSAPEIGKIPTADEQKIVVSSALLLLSGLESSEKSIGKEVDFGIFLPDKKGALQLNKVEGKFAISAVIKDDAQPYILLNSRFVPQKLTSFQMLLIKAKSSTLVSDIRETLINKGMMISAKIDLINQVNKVLDTLTTILGIFGVTALLVSAIGMFNTMTITFLERTFEIGIMKAIGATDADIRNIFLTESFFMGFLGGVGGILMGILGSFLFNALLNVVAQSFGGKNINLFIRPTWFLITIIISSSLIGFATGVWPAFRAAKLSIKETLLK